MTPAHRREISADTALSTASQAVLRQIVLGGKIDHVPKQLVERKLVRVEQLLRVDGLVGLFWSATKSGRLEVAKMEEMG